MTSKNITLTRRPEDIPKDSLDRSALSWILVGKDYPITRGYVEFLRSAGWQGLEQIPEEAIVDK